ncbi:MAG: hypothetical protein J6Q54_04830, partial [Oscillospiraceae bacterium]|nr:hypothetical protein [Oscillospiraceae bacterium]
MKKLLSILLAMLVLLSLAACGGEAEQTGPTTSVSAYKSGDGYTEIADMLSWEDLNAFPVKSADMTIDELRQLCVDFFRYTKTACWIPDDNFTYWHNSENTNALNQTAGVVYGGLPYIYVASGSIYRILDFMDPETGVVDIKGLTVNPHLYGNQCSIGAYWGWARVINSADYAWTQDIVVSKGFPRVGEYTYADYLTGWSDGYGTRHMLPENGTEVMYMSYAELKHGDGIVYYTTAGHVVMIASDAHVEYLDEAKTQIDPVNSYVTVIDQTPTWKIGTNEAGDTYEYQANVDEKWNFEKLYKGNYAPFTYNEFLGTDPIEETEVTSSIDAGAESITLTELFKTKVKANYGISDIYAQVYD